MARLAKDTEATGASSGKTRPGGRAFRTENDNAIIASSVNGGLGGCDWLVRTEALSDRLRGKTVSYWSRLEKITSAI